MRNASITIITATALIIAGLSLKVMTASSTVADAKGTTQNTMSVHDLEVLYPNMKNLLVQDAPLP